MAIRGLEFTVMSDAISPSTEQHVGMQSEHAATELTFNIDSELYGALLQNKTESDSIVYRFDCTDSMGGTVPFDTNPLDGDTVIFSIGENLTRNGGKAKVYLVITMYNSEGETIFEFRSRPARLHFENIPEKRSDNGNSKESISTLAEASKNAALRAEVAAEEAEEAQSKTELAKLALEGDSIIIFEGGDAGGYADIDLVVDGAFSPASNNPISNQVVTEKVSEIEKSIEDINENTDGYELAENKSDVIPENLTDNEAKKKFPSLKLIKDLIANWFPTNTPAADVTMECGTVTKNDVVWTYEKHSNGVYKCWGRKEITTDISDVWGNWYSSGVLTESDISFPITFTKIPNVNVALSCTPDSAALLMPSGGADFTTSITKTGAYEIVRTTQKSHSITFALNYEVIGFWK